MSTVQSGSAALSPAATQHGELYRKVTFRLITIFCLCYFAAYLDRINIGLAKLQMLDALKFSDTIYGLGAGLFFAGYILFEVPSNLILQRVGAKLWIARIMITWGILSGATMLQPDLATRGRQAVDCAHHDYVGHSVGRDDVAT